MASTGIAALFRERRQRVVLKGDRLAALWDPVQGFEHWWDPIKVLDAKNGAIEASFGGITRIDLRVFPPELYSASVSR